MSKCGDFQIENLIGVTPWSIPSRDTMFPFPTLIHRTVLPTPTPGFSFPGTENRPCRAECFRVVKADTVSIYRPFVP